MNIRKCQTIRLIWNKRARLVVFMLVLMALHLPVFCATSRAAEIEVQSRLTEATVYPNRGTLTREALVDIPAGESVILFRGLPASLMPDSLRTEGEASAKVTFGALMHRREAHDELVAPRERELVSDIEALEDRRALVEAQRQALAARKRFIENIGQQAARRVGEDVAELRFNPGEWNKAAEEIGRSLEDIYTADLALQANLRAINRRLEALTTELSRLRTGLRESYSLRLPLNAEGPTRLKIRLYYQVPGVFWRPVYDARLDTESGDLTLVQYGAVRQNTGEDWTDVRLVLSTAQPHRGATLPDLKPFWVDLYDPVRRDRTVAAEMATKATPDRAPSIGPDTQEVAFEMADIRTAGFVTEYEVPGRVSIKADGTESKLLCGIYRTDNRMQTQVKPQLSNDAYLVSRAVLKGEAFLLPGVASLFRDGAYVGQTPIPMLSPGQEQTLGFGIDDRVIVSRNILKEVRSDPRLLSRDNQLERHTATVITNRGRQAVDVVVLETVPVPRHDRIKVEVLKVHTRQGFEEDVDDVKGLLRWNLRLASGEETRLTLGWRINWPRDHELSGF